VTLTSHVHLAPKLCKIGITTTSPSLVPSHYAQRQLTHSLKAGGGGGKEGGENEKGAREGGGWGEEQ